jgi:hypothetical protein
VAEDHAFWLDYSQVAHSVHIIALLTENITCYFILIIISVIISNSSKKCVQTQYYAGILHAVYLTFSHF